MEPSSQTPRRKPISPTVAPMYAERREPAASTSSTLPGVAFSTDATKTTAPTYAAPNTAHPRACHAALPRRAAAAGPYQRSQAARRRATRRAATRRPPPLLARRRGGGEVEEMPRQAVGGRPPLLRGALDAGPPGRGQHRRQGEHGQQRQRRVDRRQQRQGHAEAQDPAAGGEQRHVHVVEDEDLVA